MTGGGKTGTRGARGRAGSYLFDLQTLPGDLALCRRLSGWRGVLDELKDRTLHRVFRRGTFLVFVQDLARLDEQSPPEGVRISEFRGPDWSLLAPIVTRRKLDRFREIAALGRTCLVAWRGDRPVGYTWYSDRMEPHVEFYDLALPEGATYGWDLYVIVAERNRGIGSALVSARLLHARGRGFRSGWRLIHSENRASRRAVNKAAGSRGGGKLVGELRCLKLLTRSWTRFRPLESDSNS